MFGENHCHIFMNGVNFREAVQANRNGVDKAHVDEVLSAYRDAGVTFLREGGDPYGASVYAAQVACEYGIDYRSPVFAIHKKGHYGSIVGLEYETIRDFAELVKKAENMGADFIKVMFSGILNFNKVGEVSDIDMDPAEMRELVHIAHETGFAVMAHVNCAQNVKNALAAGADSIEHGNYIDDETINIMAELGTIWVPTIAPYANLIGRGSFPDNSLREITRRQTENVRKALAAGVHVALGSDAGAYGVPHVSGLTDEYSFMLAAADGDKEKLDTVLAESENLVRKKFTRQ